jgi:hypothetical protein
MLAGLETLQERVHRYTQCIKDSKIVNWEFMAGTLAELWRIKRKLQGAAGRWRELAWGKKTASE